MKVLTSINITLILILISPCSFANTTQPQVSAKEEQKAEQLSKTVQELNREFSLAVMQGRQEKAKELISQGIDVNNRIFQSMTILHMAVVNGNKQAITFLLNNKASIDAKEQHGWTPLHMAVGAGFPRRKRYPDIVRILLKQGADVNAQDIFGLTPLHYAAVKGSTETVLILLKNNAVVDMKDNVGRTTLHYAAGALQRSFEDDTKNLLLDFVKLLLDHEADVNSQDNIGWTPLRYAISKRNQDVVIKKRTGETPYRNIVELLIAHGTDLSLVDNRGHTAYSWNRQKSSFLARHVVEGPHEFVDEHCSIAKLLRTDGGIYYVASDGKDNNPGTFEQPFKTINAALEVVGPGNVIYVRGGTYHCGQSLHLYKSGGQGNPICLRAYPGETPILDFSKVRGDSLFVSGTYWHIKGLVVTNGYYGVMVWGPGAHHNILEQITSYNNGWGGILFRDGAAYNIALNCDSYQNFDPEASGDTCDGFSVTYYVGQGNTCIGNRSWNNSDDGYDCWRAGAPVRFENCYAWNNGKNIWDHPFFFGNGNGFKLGTGKGRHILINCLAWGHPQRGFDLNNNTQGVIIHKCTGWGNKVNYSLNSEQAVLGNILCNNISYQGRSNSFGGKIESKANSWDTELNITLTDDDFVSLDDSKMKGPRNPDGSIPYNNFLRLASGSAAIDAGADVNMPYIAKAPDLGAFEYDPNENPENYIKMLHQYVRDHDVHKINELLDAGTDINEKDWLGYTPLHWAVYFGYHDLVELLISKGADPTIQSDTGRSALEIARSMALPEAFEGQYKTIGFFNIEALLSKLGAQD